MAAALGRALGEEVAYAYVPPEVYRTFGFPGADDLANMFQFNRDFSDEFCALRDLELQPVAQSRAPDLRRLALGERREDPEGLSPPAPAPSAASPRGENGPGRDADAATSPPVSRPPAPGRARLRRRCSPAASRPRPRPRPLRAAETPAEKARRALAERDVPFEPHAFFAAAAEGDLALVDLFLDAGMPAATRDQWGNSALLEAARSDRPDVVARLLARGAKAGDAPGGEPPLTVAAESGSLGALKALLAAGADPDQAADPARGPGRHAPAARLRGGVVGGRPPPPRGGASPRLAAPPLAPPLFLAAESGHAPTVALLLEKGADPNARGTGGAAPIWLPVWNGHVEVVRLLLLAGADVKADRATLLKGRPGQPVKPEIRKLLKNPPKPAAPAKKPPA